MADKGPGPSPLIQARIKAEIARLEATIAGQELKKLENEEENRKLDENIAASRREIDKQRANLSAQEAREVNS